MSLADKIQMALRKVTGTAKLFEGDIEKMMKEIRLSLLEADVSYAVVKKLSTQIKEKALGQKILKGLNPGEQVVKVVKDELTEIMGANPRLLEFPNNPTIIMLAGLQGSGKTTTCAKIANLVKSKEGKNPLLVACDIYRPAAIEQLKTLGESFGIKVFEKGLTNPFKTIEEALIFAKENLHDVVIIDTAGRLQIDDVLMQELKNIQSNFKINETLLTVDAMAGQEAANVAKTFMENIFVQGVVLTKIDGDSRGGAVLSVKAESGVPIMFQTFGEKVTDIEVFHPARIANRILGMGDLLTLIEKAEESFEEKESKKLIDKIKNNTFDYNDLLKQFKSMKKMGSIAKIFSFIPGLSQIKKALSEIDDQTFYKYEHIIQSMTKAERKDPELIVYSDTRRMRIAKGCGLPSREVRKLEQAFTKQKEMMRQIFANNLDLDLNQEPQEDQLTKMFAELQEKLLNNQGQTQVKKGKGKNKQRRWF